MKRSMVNDKCNRTASVVVSRALKISMKVFFNICLVNNTQVYGRTIIVNLLLHVLSCTGVTLVFLTRLLLRVTGRSCRYDSNLDQPLPIAGSVIPLP